MLPLLVLKIRVYSKHLGLRVGHTYTFCFSTEPSVSEASNHTHPQLSEQKGFPPCALDATMRNTNATIATMPRVHVTTRLIAGIVDVLSSYIAI